MPDHPRRSQPPRTPMHVMQRDDDIVVVCCDGSFWSYGPSSTGLRWHQLPSLPQPETARVEWTERFTFEEATMLDCWLDAVATAPAQAGSPLGHALKRLSDVFTALTNDSDVCHIEVEPPA